jgi:hypothetical protein
MFRPVLLVCLGLLALFSSGCSHYRLGTGSERAYETIFIAPVVTAGVLPQAAATLTTQIREAFIRDGRLRVVNTPDEADAVLTVRLTELDREKLTSIPDDTGLARKMGLTLDARATLADPSGAKTWFADRLIRAERQIFTDDDTGPLRPVQQTQAEYQLVPQLGEALAHRMTSAVLDTW